MTVSVSSWERVAITVRAPHTPSSPRLSSPLSSPHNVSNSRGLPLCQLPEPLVKVHVFFRHRTHWSDVFLWMRWPAPSGPWLPLWPPPHPQLHTQTANEWILEALQRHKLDRDGIAAAVLGPLLSAWRSILVTSWPLKTETGPGHM